jgi:hypothetical protein
MALIGMGFGAYVLLGKRDWKLGLTVLAGSLVAFAALILVAIPFFAGGRSYPYIADRYAEVGGSARGILTTLVTDPLRIVRALLQPTKVSFVIGLFASTLGLSALAGWAALLLLPTLAYLLLSNYLPQYSFTSQYSAPLIPLLVGTSILALARLRSSGGLATYRSRGSSIPAYSRPNPAMQLSPARWLGSLLTPASLQRTDSQAIFLSAATSMSTALRVR